MAEQLAVEVNVKNVTHGTWNTEDGTHRTSSFIWLGYQNRSSVPCKRILLDSILNIESIECIENIGNIVWSILWRV